MSRDRARRKERELVREAFGAAAGTPEPDLSRLREAMPGLMARAAGIRAPNADADPYSVLGALARNMLPKLAAAAALLVLVAAAVGPSSQPAEQSDDYAIENLMLTGEVSDSAADVLLEGLVWEGSDHG